MSYTYDNENNLIEMVDKFDDPVPSSMSQEPKTKKSLNPREYKQMMNYLTRAKKEIPKDSIEPQRAPFKKKSDRKVPPKFAKSKEDIKEEFELFEVPMIMKEFENWSLDNPGKSFRDYLREQNLINERQKKQYENMVLSGALAKIDNVMSGIMTMARGGIIKDPSYTYFNSGGKAKIKEPKSIKKINLADYFRYGMTIAELTDKERELVNTLLQKSFSKSSTDN